MGAISIDFLDSDEFVWNFGVGLSVVGSLASSGGILLQKLVKAKVEDNPSLGPEFMHFRYLAGLVSVVIGLICKTIICAILPQLALAALSAQSYIYTLVLESLFLSEIDMPFVSIISTLVVFIGIVLAVLSSDIIDIDYSLESVHELFTQTTSLIFCGVIAAVLFVPKFLLSSSGKSGDDVTDLSILDLVHRLISSSSMAMLFGCVLKVIAETGAYAITFGLDDFNKYKYDAVFWVILFVLFGIAKMRIISVSLQSYHQLLFLPIYQGLSAAMHAAAGVFLFHELDHDATRGAVNIPMYILGVTMVVAGLCLLALNFDPNMHSVPNQEEYSQDKESLLNSNLDSIYGPPGGKPGVYPSQGHSGEIRRGEMRNPPRRGGDFDEYSGSNPMLRGEVPPNHRGNHGRPPPSRYDPGGRYGGAQQGGGLVLLEESLGVEECQCLREKYLQPQCTATPMI